MKIIVFAALKEYFSSGFTPNKNIANITELFDLLTEEKPECKALLSKSRFAVNDTFINPEYQFNGTETVSIIPPSSGG